MSSSLKLKFKHNLDRIIGIPVVGISIPFFLKSGEPMEIFYPWILASLIITTIAWIGTPYAYSKIENRYPWQTHTFQRVIAIIAMLLLIGSVMSIVLYLSGELYVHLSDEIYSRDFNLVPGYFISFLMLFLVTALYEVFYLIGKWKQSIIETERLEKEKALTQYQVLKNQINPHFLFNSLSVLSSLIYPEPKPEKAKHYLDEFAKIYRYVLEMNDETVVTLQREIDFLHSFFYLMKIRYGDDLHWEQIIPAEKMSLVLPPLTLQLLVENVFKHNQVDEQHPMYIHIFAENHKLLITNNLHPKNNEAGGFSRSRLALENLKGRYALLTDEKPEFYKTSEQFVCKIPLIEED